MFDRFHEKYTPERKNSFRRREAKSPSYRLLPRFKNEQDEESEENPKELTGIPQRFCEAKALWEEAEQAL